MSRAPPSRMRGPARRPGGGRGTGRPGRTAARPHSGGRGPAVGPAQPGPDRHDTTRPGAGWGGSGAGGGAGVVGLCGGASPRSGQERQEGAAAGVAEIIEDSYPLTPVQQALLAAHGRRPQAGVGAEQVLVSFTGALNPHVFAQAWQYVADRHPALRTAFARGRTAGRGRWSTAAPGFRWRSWTGGRPVRRCRTRGCESGWTGSGLRDSRWAGRR